MERRSVDDLLAHCRELGIRHAVTFLGGVSDEDLIHAYREADVFVLPSVAQAQYQPPTGEGFGLVYAEAGAFGVPSIASTSGGGALDFVENGVTGMTTAPGDSADLAAAILRLLSDPQERSRLGQAAQDRVRVHHLPGQFGTRLASALR